MAEPILEVEELTKRYGERTVVAGVSLELPPGEVYAIVGPSGCGKSTLLRCLSGLEPFDGGRLRVAGVEMEANLPLGQLRRVAREVRRRVGMVFQQFHLFPHRTALENVMEGMLYVLGMGPGEARQQALQLLAEVGLEHRAHAYPAELSGGEQQRVAIARAMATRPAVLLLDEPTSALDPPRAAEVREAILRFADQGQSMILVTHSPRLARTTAGKIFMMDGGAIVEAGPPEQLFEQPTHPATARFVRAASFV